MSTARVMFSEDEPQICRGLRARFLEAIFDQLSDAVVLCREDLQIFGVNPAAERLFGMVASELIGQNCQALFHCSSCEPDGGMRRTIGCQFVDLPSGTFNLHVKNGRQRLVVIRTAQLRDDTNSVEGVVATIKDITEESHPVVCRIIAESQAMRDLLDFARRIAASEATSVLIEGENGTGKDLIAKTLHDQSPRQAEPFLAINCAAIPETLLESELFGFEKGAFTDARAQKRGLFELADKGTLFLDEIGEMPLSLQVKLLRVLEDQTFRRLGGLRDIHVDIRIVAATNKNLREALKEGAFRLDLYYRLGVIQVVVPPLRERPEDILPLARFFIEHYNAKFKQQIEGVSPETESLLLTYHWPGNVRELRNAIERAMILEDTAYIRPASLRIEVPDGGSALVSLPEAGLSLLEHERHMVVQALDAAAGNQTQAARLLRITRDTLRYKMKKFDLASRR
ncbi:MAG TPA: sigma 54-interacting transcriptional regulator [Bryobacteraceae bacterium]|nr:sigma 54-interacting transcriptional regulator [Bryobacteraceae bacterium]